MKKIGKFFAGRGIQQKIFNLVLITIILTIGAHSIVIVYQSLKENELFQETNRQQKEAITEISSDILGEELTIDLYES